MSVIKARVLTGRYQGEIVRISNVSVDEMGRKRAASMPFVSGSTGSRTMTQTKNMAKLRPEKSRAVVGKEVLAVCERCGEKYNIEARKGLPGKVTQCENCAEEIEESTRAK
jgi:hypothetical protein